MEFDPQNFENTAPLHLAQAAPDNRSGTSESQDANTEIPEPPTASQTSDSNGLSSFLLKPMSEHTPSVVASWFGTAPIGAVLSGSVMALMALQSKDKTTSTTPDTQAPILRSADISNSAGNQLVLRYSESLNDTLPATSAFQVMVDGISTTVSSVARSSDMNNLILTLGTPITRASQVSVSLSDGSVVKDLAGNTASTFRDQAVTVTDLVAPTLLSSQAITNAEKSVIVLRFSETLKSGTLDPANFSISVAGVSQTITAQEVLGDSIRLTLGSKITGTSPNINLQYTPPTDISKAVKDAAGNLAAVIGPVGGVAITHTLDTTAPALNTDTLAVAATERQVRVIRLNFNEALDAGSLPDPSSFTVNVASGGSTQSVAVSSLRLSGSVLELTLATTVTDMQAGLRVSYARPSTGNILKDWAGQAVAAFARSVSTVDAVAPNMLSSRFTNDRTLELTFDENLSSQGPLASAWSLTANGGTVLKAATSSVSGRTLTLSFATAIESSKTALLAYTAPTSDQTALNQALQDSLGNDSGNISRTLDTTGPSLNSVNGAVTSANGLQVFLNYNETLLSPSSSGTPVIPAVSASAFVVRKSTGESIAVSSVSISGTQVLLNLASALKPSDTVSVFYTAPTTNIAVNNAALQDSSGNDAASLGSGVTGQAVTNNAVLVKLDSNVAALDQLVIQLNENITGNLPALSAFTIKAGTVTQTITGIAKDPADGSKLVLSLSGSVDDPGALLVSYTQPSSNPLTGASGKTLASFTDQNFGQVITSTNAADTVNGAANRVDYFLGTTGNDSLSGLGGSDHFVWPDFGASGPSGFTQTLQDFGFKKGSGVLQGTAEADLLDLSQLLNGYTQANQASFLKAIKNADNKLVLQIDHDGGSVFTPTANLLFNNVTVNASNQLLINGQFISDTVNGVSANLTLLTLIDHLRLEGQLIVL